MTRQIQILLTRPRRQSERFARQCRERLGPDIGIVISPLIEIETLRPPAAPEEARHFLFTSQNGVRAAAEAWPDHRPPCFTVGDRTAAVARELGYDARPCGGTVESMIAHLVASRPAGPYLHLRGEHSTGQLAQRLNAAGLKTEEAVIYRQNAQDLSSAAEKMLCGDMPVLVPLFSPRTATIFWKGRANVQARVTIIAISQAVARECAGRGAAVRCAETPTAEAVLDCISSVVATTTND